MYIILKSIYSSIISLINWASAFWNLSPVTQYNITLILKSSSTIITDGNSIAIQKEGTTALAKAGSGDGLSGILCGLLAYIKEDTFKVSCLGSYILGISACFSSKNNPEEVLTITEIVKNVSKVVKEIKKWWNFS